MCARVSTSLHKLLRKSVSAIDYVPNEFGKADLILLFRTAAHRKRSAANQDFRKLDALARRSFHVLNSAIPHRPL
jgi:hypothetical protein